MLFCVSYFQSVLAKGPIMHHLDREVQEQATMLIAVLGVQDPTILGSNRTVSRIGLLLAGQGRPPPADRSHHEL